VARLGRASGLVSLPVDCAPHGHRVEHGSTGPIIAAKPRPRGENVFDLMDALKRSIGEPQPATPAKGKKPRKAAAGQKEMLLPISSKRV
jgi:hypothetical protein